MTIIRPPLTREQEDDICYIIGEWYLKWRHTMVQHSSECKGCDCQQYRLGYAKEMLKTMICNSEK